LVGGKDTIGKLEAGTLGDLKISYCCVIVTIITKKFSLFCLKSVRTTGSNTRMLPVSTFVSAGDPVADTKAHSTLKGRPPLPVRCGVVGVVGVHTGLANSRCRDCQYQVKAVYVSGPSEPRTSSAMPSHNPSCCGAYMSKACDQRMIVEVSQRQYENKGNGCRKAEYTP
jgi:hypothetical protein